MLGDRKDGPRSLQSKDKAAGHTFTDAASGSIANERRSCVIHLPCTQAKAPIRWCICDSRSRHWMILIDAGQIEMNEPAAFFDEILSTSGPSCS
jgi:hypothetical protein